MTIPFLRPNLVPVDTYLDRLRRIDLLRRYSNFGPLATEFETRVVDELFEGQGRALTVCNATIGLMLAISAVRRPGARLALMPSYTFAATPLAAQWCGLSPYFVDVRDSDWCPDEDQLSKVLQQRGEDVAVIVTYATFGAPMNLKRYEAFVRAGTPVVVDAAPGLGARGPCRPFADGFSGPVVYSLHATKAFAIGEGGLIFSHDEDLIERIRRMSNFGFGAERSVLESGLNAKLSEYSAAIALATLDVFPNKMQRRIEIYDTYRCAFEADGLLARGWTFQQFEGQVAHQFAPVLAPQGLRNVDVVAVLAKHAIEARTYFSPACHRHPQFKHCEVAALDVTSSLEERSVSLPLWEEMSEADVHAVVAALSSISSAGP